MNFGFLLPAALAALGTMLVPLLIHLARRSEQRPTVFAALRWLQPKSRPRHRIRFDEWPLLLVRLLLLVLLALLLARPVLFGSGDEQPIVAVIPGVDLPQARSQRVAAQARWLWLSPGFPSFDGTHGPGADASGVSITSLLRELDASLPPEALLTVLAPERLGGVDAERPVLSRRVDWRVLPGATPRAPASARHAAPTLSVRYAPQREPSVRYLRAVDAAWRGASAASAPDIAPTSQPLAATSANLAWLAPGPLPPAVADWVRAGGTALLDAQTTFTADAAPPTTAATALARSKVTLDCGPGTPGGAPVMLPLWRNDEGEALVEGCACGRGRLLRLTRALVPQQFPELLDPHFAQHLQRLFAPPAPGPSLVRAVDFEPLAGGRPYTPAPRELQPWLVALIALAFLVERWMATATRQHVAP